MTAHRPTPSDGGPPRAATDRSHTTWFQIRVVGHLGSRWTAWFDGLDITNESDGTCLIQGPVLDQAALHGLLNKVRDLGLPLQSLTQFRPDDRDAIGENTTGASS